MASHQVIHIHRDAPPKPQLGTSCNGCGICCVAEPCPPSRFLLGQKQGPCRALTWGDKAGRYACGMMTSPSQYLIWLPSRLDGIAGRLFAGWLAAGEGCDSDAEMVE